MIDLPRSKYSKPIHTPGKEFTLNGKEYVGWYVVTYQEKFYTGKTITKESKEIQKVVTSPTNSNTVKVFVEQEVKPTLEDRAAGIWRRYFIQKVVNKVIIEVTKERYQAYLKTPGYKVLSLFWIIKGPAENVVKGPYVYKGASEKNREAVGKLENSFQGIQNYIKDYSKFVE